MPTVNTLEVAMGTRGPVPKRDAERRRRNKPTTPTKTGAAGARFPQPRALAGWHPSMTRWYKSLAESGQAQFFEASDWEGARRRASVELTKAKPGGGVGKPAPGAVMDDYRRSLGG